MAALWSKISWHQSTAAAARCGGLCRAADGRLNLPVGHQAFSQFVRQLASAVFNLLVKAGNQRRAWLSKPRVGLA